MGSGYGFGQIEDQGKRIGRKRNRTVQPTIFPVKPSGKCSQSRTNSSQHPPAPMAPYFSRQLPLRVNQVAILKGQTPFMAVTAV